MLGVILGVASLIAMSALVKGMENGMREALIAIGGLEKVRVEEQDIPPQQLHLADQAVGNTMNDVHALRESAPLMSMITPEMRLPRATFTHGGKTFSPWNFVGTWPSALDMNQHVIEHGRMFNEIDDENARSVCVIGTALRDELFGAPEKVGREIVPVGEQISINGEPLTIIGMFKHYESEQEYKMRMLEQEKPIQQQNGPAPSRRWGNRRGGIYVYRLKNATVYFPPNTMWIKSRSAAGSNSPRGARLSGLSMRIA